MAALPKLGFPQPVTLGTIPKEGSKVAHQTINWVDYFDIHNNTTAVKINLLSQFQSGQFTTTQTLYVDNTGTPFPVRFTSEETGQSFIAPPSSHGVYHLFCGPSPVIDVAAYNLKLQYTRTEIFLLNTNHTPYTVSAPAAGYTPSWFNFNNVAFTSGVKNNWSFVGGTDQAIQLNAFNLTILNTVALAASGVLIVQFIETGGPLDGFVLWSDAVLVPASMVTSQMYRAIFNFTNPIRVSSNKATLSLLITLAANPGIVVFGAINTSYFFLSLTP